MQNSGLFFAFNNVTAIPSALDTSIKYVEILTYSMYHNYQALN